MNTVAVIRDRLSHWREWEANPIVVKELRQAVRSSAVPAMLLVFLTVLFFTTLAFITDQAAIVGTAPSLGSDLFVAFSAVLTIVSLLFIPFYVGGRMGFERAAGNVDLLYVSTLTPGQIVRGKLLCGWYLAVLFFSAAMPFMAFTSLLRGIDLPSIFFVLFRLFLIVCASVPVTIFFVCLPASRGLKILLIICAVPFLLSYFSFFLNPNFNLIQAGLGAQMGTAGFWSSFLGSLVSPLASLVLLYFLSVALISPPSANRALPLRICVTVVWAIRIVLTYLSALAMVSTVATPGVSRVVSGGVPAGLGPFSGIPMGYSPYGGMAGMSISLASSSYSISSWASSISVMLAIAVLVVISNQDRLSPRVRRAIPARPLKRLVAFLFYNGAAGGLVWAMLLTVLTYIMLMLFPSSRAPAYNSRPGYAFSAELYYGAFYLYVFAYALTGLAIQRRFFARRPAKLAGLIAVFIPIALMIVPLIIRFFFNRLTWGWVEGEQLGNLFNLMGHADDGDATSNHFFCALVWLVIAVAFNLKWFTQQGRRFQPLDHAESISPSL